MTHHVVIEGISEMRMPMTIKHANGTMLLNGIPLSRVLLCVMASAAVSDAKLAQVASVYAGMPIGLDGRPMMKVEIQDLVVGEGVVQTEGYGADRINIVGKGSENAKKMMDDGEVTIIRDGGAE